jgi:hypothetical protein
MSACLSISEAVDKIIKHSYGRNFDLILFSDGVLYASYHNNDDLSDSVEIGVIEKSEFTFIQLKLFTEGYLSKSY